MPDFTFDGFTLGSALAITAAQGGRTASGSVASWGVPVADIDILVTRSGVDAAPAAVWFEAIGIAGFETAGGPGPGEIYDPAFHDITYIWDFGDAADAVPVIALNIPDAWKNRNVAYGKRVAHVFDQPGDYPVTVFAVEPVTGRTASHTLTISVGDPKTAFPGNRTIIFDPAGAGDPAQYPSADVRTDWAGVEAARNALGATTAQILMAPGTQVTGATAPSRGLNKSWLNSSSPISNIRIGALDPADAARPVFGPIGTAHASLWERLRDSCNEMVFFGVDFRGSWDATTETGWDEHLFSSTKGDDVDEITVLHRCTLDGFVSVNNVNTSGSATNRIDFMMNECDVTNWRSYGVFLASNAGGMATAAFIACAFHQPPGALLGAAGKTGFYNEHGCVRDSGMQQFYMGICDLFQDNGWSNGGSGAGAANGVLRLNTNGAEGVEINIERVAAEGLISLESRDPGNVIDSPINCVFDKVLNFQGPRVFKFRSYYGGATWRNFVAFAPDVKPGQGTRMGEQLLLDSANPGPGNLDAPQKVYASSFIDLRDSVNGPVVHTPVDVEDFTDVTIENNVAYAPNKSTPETGDGPFDLASTIEGFTSRYAGRRANFEQVEGNFDQDIAPGGSFTIPYSEITTDLTDSYDYPATGAVTDQAYWQAIAATDTRHMFYANTGAMLYAELGDFTVEFLSSGVRITNTTTKTWKAGKNWDAKLDRVSLIPPMDQSYGTAGMQVPLARPLDGSPARNSGGSGLKAYDDFLGAVRPDKPLDDKGAFLEA